MNEQRSERFIDRFPRTVANYPILKLYANRYANLSPAGRRIPVIAPSSAPLLRDEVDVLCPRNASRNYNANFLSLPKRGFQVTDTSS